MGRFCKLIFIFCLVVPFHSLAALRGSVADALYVCRTDPYHICSYHPQCFLAQVGPLQLFSIPGYSTYQYGYFIRAYGICDDPTRGPEASNGFYIAATCPSDSTNDFNTDSCRLPVIPEKNLGTTKCNNVGFSPTGNPINQGTGKKLQIETDLTSTSLSLLNFQRFYNSVPPSSRNFIGNNWQHTYSQLIIPIADTEVNVIKNDGKTYSFSLGFKV